MYTTPRDAYLETQIATATPQKLRLMLIEGGVRLGRRIVELWNDQQDEAALESLIRCRGIISELLAGVRPDGSALGRQVIALYTFLFKSLTEAQLHRDAAKVQAVVEVLEEERLTWQQLCEQMPDAPDADLRRQQEPQEIAAPHSLSGNPAIPFLSDTFASGPLLSERFSLDA